MHSLLECWKCDNFPTSKNSLLYIKTKPAPSLSKHGCVGTTTGCSYMELIIILKQMSSCKHCYNLGRWCYLLLIQSESNKQHAEARPFRDCLPHTVRKHQHQQQAETSNMSNILWFKGQNVPWSCFGVSRPERNTAMLLTFFMPVLSEKCA